MLSWSYFVDIYSNGNPIAMNLAFSNITNYQDISPGKDEKTNIQSRNL